MKKLPGILITMLAVLWYPMTAGGATSRLVVVHYIHANPVMTHEDSAAVAMVEKAGLYKCTAVMAKDVAALKNPRLIWIHLPDAASWERFLAEKSAVPALRALYDKGARMLCTDYAALLPHEMNIETRKPEIRIDTVVNDWLCWKKGFQGFRGHPLFEEMHGGDFILSGEKDIVMPFVGFFGSAFPAEGKVVAIDKSYVFIHQERKLVIEYEGNGRILSIGSTVYCGYPNLVAQNLRQFLNNALRYLGGEKSKEPLTYWQQFKNLPVPFSIRTSPLKTASGESMHRLPASHLLLKRAATNEFFDVAGRRALTMGKENGGIDEIWVHPNRILRNLEIGLIGPDSVQWLKTCAESVYVRPESFTRTFKTPAGRIKEIVFSSLDRAGSALHLEAAAPVRLVIRFRSDLRWMWPYDANAFGDLHYAYDEGLNALHVRDTTGDFYALFGGDSKPVAHAAGPYAALEWKNDAFVGTPTTLNQVYAGFVYELNAANGNAITFVMAGTNEGSKRTQEEYRAVAEHPRGEYVRMVDHCRQLLATSVTMKTPDTEFNALFQWAIIGADRFVANTYPLGEGLLAGYATTARGWDGSQKISGRPGYAWYFGRDSEWSGFAMDDYGDVETVRKQLLFLTKFQDRTGKIFHEIATSGVVHYDASDATPLYPVLAGHYLRASGDVKTCRAIWLNLEKAMDFLYSTDTDGDGLIENTNVGHGWIEGGELFGVHTEFYLAGLWAQALTEMAGIADLLDLRVRAEKYRKDAARVLNKMNTEFWNKDGRYFNMGLFKDGTYFKEATALAAVPMYFGQLEDEKVRPMLEGYASNGFSCDWGVRIISTSSPMFKPTGYHYGAVWPLFTGWVSLGEYEYGNSSQGFTHMMNNLYIKNHWALGFVQEVMHGLVYRANGVCPHQCWSETNILHPAITGMAGWKPDAPHRSAILRPRFPMHWETATVEHLRSGDSRVAVTMKRSASETTYELTLERGPALTIRLQPELVDGQHLLSVLVDGKERTTDGAAARRVLAVPIEIKLAKKSIVILKHAGGAALCPIVPKPAPCDTSLGYRIVSESVSGSEYAAVLEGSAGTSLPCSIRIFDQSVASIEGAERVGAVENGLLKLNVSFEGTGARYARKTIRIHLTPR